MAKIENYLLGMDCGTTNIKAIILAEDGTVVAESSRPSKFLSPGPNMQEQDAKEWWQNTVEIFRALNGKPEKLLLNAFVVFVLVHIR